MEKIFEGIPFEEIKQRAEFYKEDIYKFTRDLVRCPGGSGDESLAATCTIAEMQKLGFNKIDIDPMGNILAYIGTGSHLIAMDGHLDVVGAGNLDNWNYDPYEGFEDENRIIGRGTTDMKGAIASIVYAAKIITDLDIQDDFTLLVSASVAEEDCDGLSWKYMIEEQNIRPEFVLLAEPSDGKICRAQKGRMEISVSTYGTSAHGSIPHTGDNAIYKMSGILTELRALNENLLVDDLLGKGCLTVSEISSTSPSRCAVSDSCTISIDRRLTWGEKPEDALQEIRNLPAVKMADAEVSIYNYDEPSYTGLEYGQECSFKPWKMEEKHDVTQSVANAYKELFKKDAVIDIWPFSTNGVSIMGEHNIPVIGYGPGELKFAHAPNEEVKKADLILCAALYAAIPSVYVRMLKGN
ncbi:YgeY family selenium metabolism-linked hydrolase [Poseidonibacter lekithochrous]|uniref:YgeY family selenium metabolism-linked hydrolase n=1 Tax=Poseidonibacter lekithochrous TaxID=1904463 RepID=UPI0008FC20A8|nr:YgeY family selenium metabolism-linked hydrolase [Poseidonibacter lekithochrous]QKJ21652.1 peptidase, M20 family [Poseidonibacter lekithochrous]